MIVYTCSNVYSVCVHTHCIAWYTSMRTRIVHNINLVNIVGIRNGIKFTVPRARGPKRHFRLLGTNL
jgi:hypothetical protein